MTNQNTSPYSVLLLLAALLVLVSVARAVSTSDLRKIGGEERNYKQKKVIDISHTYVPDLPTYGSKHGLGNFITLQTSIKLGDLSNYSVFKLAIHSGTRVDAPGHFNETLFELRYDVVSLDLRTLNGPVLVVDTPRDKKIIAFTSDGAEYLVQNTDIKLIGVDYLSVAINRKDDLVKVHQLLLYRKDIIPVEGLKLDDAVPGVYTIHCLPLRLVHGDGSPARCILFQYDVKTAGTSLGKRRSSNLN